VAPRPARHYLDLHHSPSPWEDDMANTRTTTNGTTSGGTLEVLASPMSAALVAAMIDESAPLLEQKYRDMGESRMRDMALAAFRGTARQLETYHDGDGGS
jgi:hypothetical protein